MALAVLWSINCDVLYYYSMLMSNQECVVKLMSTEE